MTEYLALESIHTFLMQTGESCLVRFADKLWRRTVLIFSMNGLTYIYSCHSGMLITCMTRIVWPSFLLNSLHIWTDFWVSHASNLTHDRINHCVRTITLTWNALLDLDPIWFSCWFNYCCNKDVSLTGTCYWKSEQNITCIQTRCLQYNVVSWKYHFL